MKTFLWTVLLTAMWAQVALAQAAPPLPEYTEPPPPPNTTHLNVSAYSTPSTAPAKIWFKNSDSTQGKIPVDMPQTRVRLAYSPTVFDWRGYIYSGQMVTINRQTVPAECAGVAVFAYREDGKALEKGDVELNVRVMGVANPVLPRLSYQKVDKERDYMVSHFSVVENTGTKKIDTLYYKTGGAFWIPGASMLSTSGQEYMGVLALVGLKHVKEPRGYILGANNQYEVYAQVKPTPQGISKGIIDDTATIRWWGGGFTDSVVPDEVVLSNYINDVKTYLPKVNATTQTVYSALPLAQ